MRIEKLSNKKQTGAKHHHSDTLEIVKPTNTPVSTDNVNSLNICNLSGGYDYILLTLKLIIIFQN